MTLAVFQRVRYTPLVSDVFMMKVIGAARMSAAAFSTLDEMPSVPKLFLFDKLRMILRTRVSATVLKLKVGGALCFIFSFSREWDHGGMKSISDQVHRIEVMIEQIEAATKETREVVVMGDFNLCTRKWYEKGYRLKTISELWLSATSLCGLQLLELGDTYFPDHPTSNGD